MDAHAILVALVYVVVVIVFRSRRFAWYLLHRRDIIAFAKTKRKTIIYLGSSSASMVNTSVCAHLHIHIHKIK